MRKGGPGDANLLMMVTTGKCQSQDLNPDHSNSKVSSMLHRLREKKSQYYSIESLCLHRTVIKILPPNPPQLFLPTLSLDKADSSSYISSGAAISTRETKSTQSDFRIECYQDSAFIKSLGQQSL